MILNFPSISREKSHFDYLSLSQDFEWNPQLKMISIFKVLTKQLFKAVFSISNDVGPKCL